MKQLRIIFAGTPEFAVPSLNALRSHPRAEIAAVYTQPDRPSGRGRKLTPGPVKRCAEDAAISVRQPVDFTTSAIRADYAALKADVLVVAAYGLILPQAILEMTTHAINVHASLLPRWRGAAPIQRAIMAGDTRSGISIMRIVERLDAGPVWLQRACDIAPEETGGSLHDKLAELGGIALTAALDLFDSGPLGETPQDETRVSYAEKITAADQVIDWTRSAVDLERQIRALAPNPGARARLGALEVKVHAATLATETASPTATATPGCLVNAAGDVLAVMTGAGILKLHELQPQGKQRMSAAAFINGYGKLL